MKHILIKLLNYQYLNRDESRELLVAIVKGDVPETQVSAIITIFLMRSISVEEVLGFREALVEMRVSVDLNEYKAIDIVGTGGDGKNTFNISTAACFVVAGAGYPVVKHGNYGATSVSGSSNAMEQQGVKFTTDIDILRKSIEKSNIAYLHAPFFSPALKAVAPVRKSLGVRNFFNVLGPLINPADPEYQLLGVYDLSMTRLYSYIFQASKKKFGIVHSLDGYDEISLTGQFKVVSNKGEQLFLPEDLGFNRIKQEEIFGGNTVEEAVSVFNKVMRCEATEAQMNVAIVNAAFAIQIVEAEKNIDECIEIA
ncbi:MAG: anthranilate phosphoribosyltransferase, partial [Bacteroidia bacterium]|nr:anthranilate phosphoribosyltransferase [Bacteroidia bacterium]